MPYTGQPASPPPPPPSASPHLNLRFLVFNFINKKFLLLFLFSVADFFSRTKSFININGNGQLLYVSNEVKVNGTWLRTAALTPI